MLSEDQITLLLQPLELCQLLSLYLHAMSLMVEQGLVGSCVLLYHFILVLHSCHVHLLLLCQLIGCSVSILLLTMIIIVILLHVFGQVVFGAEFGSQVVPHVISSIYSQCLGTLVSCNQSVHVAPLFSTCS